MIIKKIQKMLNPVDERYHDLYLNYTKLRLDLKNLEDAKQKEIMQYKQKLKTQVVKNLVVLFDVVENLKNTAHQIKKPTQETQQLTMDVMIVKKKLKEVMKRFNLQEYTPEKKNLKQEDLEIVRLEKSKLISSGEIIKIIKPGLTYEDEIIKKPMVILSQ